MTTTERETTPERTKRREVCDDEQMNYVMNGGFSFDLNGRWGWQPGFLVLICLGQLNFLIMYYTYLAWINGRGC